MIASYTHVSSRRRLTTVAFMFFKEIQLTNDLMELFTKYQISSDLISYAGDPDATTQCKLSEVKAHVAELMETIAKVLIVL